MKLVKYEVRGTITDVTDDPLPPKHHTFTAFVAVDTKAALKAARECAKFLRRTGQRHEDFDVVNIRIVKITEEDVD